jgi:hypothetical protein
MPSVVQQPPKLKLLHPGCKFMDGLLFGGSLVTRRVRCNVKLQWRLAYDAKFFAFYFPVYKLKSRRAALGLGFPGCILLVPKSEGLLG